MRTTRAPPATLDNMIWVGGGILYVVLLITLGIMCLRKGHWVMFVVGIFLPFMWLIGAVIPPVTARR
ncbi:MAG TPA: hypothetical protein VL856_07150 [Acidimicrobiia bacterium]|nr:hypothetical protein [Acidimicrobiia bacterium]